jgi:hypothetical protein
MGPPGPVTGFPLPFYFSPNINRVIKSRRIRWDGNIACIGDRKVAHRVLMGRSEKRRPLRRRRRRWAYNIKKDATERYELE